MIELLRSLWLKHPDQRLGQLFDNYARKNVDTDLFNQEDDITEEILKNHLSREGLQELTRLTEEYMGYDKE
jgi:uncharacterized protein YihD (DUF1040 family)